MQNEVNCNLVQLNVTKIILKHNKNTFLTITLFRTFPKYVYPVTNILMSFGINITLAIAIERYVC